MRKLILGFILCLNIGLLCACGKNTTSTVTNASTESTEQVIVEDNHDHEHEEQALEEVLYLDKTYTLEDIDNVITDYDYLEIVDYVDEDTISYTLLSKGSDGTLYYEIDTERYYDYNVNTSNIIHKLDKINHDVYLYLAEDDTAFIEQHYEFTEDKLHQLISTDITYDKVEETYNTIQEDVLSWIKDKKISCEYKDTELIVHNYYDVVTVACSDDVSVICYINTDTKELSAIELSDNINTYVLTNQPIINTELYDYKTYKDADFVNLSEYFKFHYTFVVNATQLENKNISDVYTKQLDNVGVVLRGK